MPGGKWNIIYKEQLIEYSPIDKYDINKLKQKIVENWDSTYQDLLKIDTLFSSFNL